MNSPYTLSERKERRKLRTIRYVHRVNFDGYIRNVLKSLSVDASISQPAVSIVDSILKCTFEDFGDTMKEMMLRNKKRTLNEKDVQCAVKVLLPGEMIRHALAVGAQAVTIYREVVTSTPN